MMTTAMTAAGNPRTDGLRRPPTGQAGGGGGAAVQVVHKGHHRAPEGKLSPPHQRPGLVQASPTTSVTTVDMSRRSMSSWMSASVVGEARQEPKRGGGGGGGTPGGGGRNRQQPPSPQPSPPRSTVRAAAAAGRPAGAPTAVPRPSEEQEVHLLADSDDSEEGDGFHAFTAFSSWGGPLRRSSAAAAPAGAAPPSEATSPGAIPRKRNGVGCYWKKLTDDHAEDGINVTTGSSNQGGAPRNGFFASPSRRTTGSRSSNRWTARSSRCPPVEQKEEKEKKNRTGTRPGQKVHQSRIRKEQQKQQQQQQQQEQEPEESRRFLPPASPTAAGIHEAWTKSISFSTDGNDDDGVLDMSPPEEEIVFHEAVVGNKTIARRKDADDDRVLASHLQKEQQEQQHSQASSSRHIMEVGLGSDGPDRATPPSENGGKSPPHTPSRASHRRAHSNHDGHGRTGRRDRRPPGEDRHQSSERRIRPSPSVKEIVVCEASGSFGRSRSDMSNQSSEVSSLSEGEPQQQRDPDDEVPSPILATDEVPSPILATIPTLPTSATTTATGPTAQSAVDGMTLTCSGAQCCTTLTTTRSTKEEQLVGCRDGDHLSKESSPPSPSPSKQHRQPQRALSSQRQLPSMEFHLNQAEQPPHDLSAQMIAIGQGILRHLLPAARNGSCYNYDDNEEEEEKQDQQLRPTTEPAREKELSSPRAQPINSNRNGNGRSNGVFPATAMAPSKCLVLLMDPRQLIFEVIPAFSHTDPFTVGDLLEQIPQQATDYRLKHQVYTGLAHGGVHICASGAPLDDILKENPQGMPLIAVPLNYSAGQIELFAATLLKNPKVTRMIQDHQTLLGMSSSPPGTMKTADSAAKDGAAPATPEHQPRKYAQSKTELYTPSSVPTSIAADTPAVSSMSSPEFPSLHQPNKKRAAHPARSFSRHCRTQSGSSSTLSSTSPLFQRLAALTPAAASPSLSSSSSYLQQPQQQPRQQPMFIAPSPPREPATNTRLPRRTIHPDMDMVRF
jgi:hypothetical protein